MSYRPGDFRDVEIHVHRAAAIGDQHVPTFAILAHDEVQEFRDLQQAAQLYDAEAKQIVEVLVGSLPGGVVDRVLAGLLQHQLSLFRVAHQRGPIPSAGYPDPKCPKCGFTMCQLFDERPLNDVATVAEPNGQYQCYHCTPVACRRDAVATAEGRP